MDLFTLSYSVVFLVYLSSFSIVTHDCFYCYFYFVGLEDVLRDDNW